MMTDATAPKPSVCQGTFKGEGGGPSVSSVRSVYSQVHHEIFKVCIY